MPTDVPTLQTEAVVGREDMDVATLQTEAVVKRDAGLDVATLMIELVIDAREYRVSGMLGATEAGGLPENRVSGMLGIPEANSLKENRVSGMLGVPEANSLNENRVSGMLLVPEYVPFVFVPMGDRETTGRELSGESMINDRKFTGQRRKKRRGY